jgi:hypothetical protein
VAVVVEAQLGGGRLRAAAVLEEAGDAERARDAAVHAVVGDGLVGERGEDLAEHILGVISVDAVEQ